MTPIARMAPWLRRFWLVGLGAVATGWAICSLTWPFGPDQGCFAFVGDAVLRGGMPYRDAWDFKGPLVYVVYAALQAVFGRQMWAVRALDIGLLVAAAFGVMSIVSRFASRFSGVGTALVLILAFASFGSWYTAQPDGWAALALVGVVALLLRAPGQCAARDAAFAAFLLGGCTLLKPLYAAFLLLVVIGVWPSSREERPRFFRRLAIAGAAFLVPIAATVGWLAARGDLGDAFDVHVRFNFERIRTDPYLQMSAVQTLQSAIGMLTVRPLLAVVTPVAALGVGYVWHDRRRAGVVMVLWVVLALWLVASQRKFLVQNYSWHPLFQPLGILAGIGFGRIWNVSSPDRGAARALVVVGALVVAKLSAHDPAAQIARWAKYVRGHETRAEYETGFEIDIPALKGGPSTDFGFSVPRDEELAAYFATHSTRDEQVFVWNDPFVNYISDRAAVAPVNLVEAYDLFGTESRRERYRADLVERLGSDRAAYFGASQKDLAAGSTIYNIPANFPALAEVLATDYEKVDIVGDVQLFRHRRGELGPR